jgi:site-specific DNA recombinase
MAQQQSQAVLYTRVSSKDQEKEGFSIPAQQRLLREYALGKGLTILQEFSDVETAKQSGRSSFAAMLGYLKKHACRTILVEKTDRLYRNIKDWSSIDELGVTIHFVKENVVIGPESRSADQLMHGIKVVMARNYSLNLGEETRKGMLEKARSGIYPSCAPLGYLNAEGSNGKRTIVPDPNSASVITELYDHFATGKYSIKSLAAKFRLEGCTLRGRPLNTSLVHQILRKRLYTGEFDWDGVTYQGTHEPLVTPSRWQRVQEMLDARADNKTRKVKHDFAFTGVIHCGHCGCYFVGELKKHRYVYYHCTGNRGKCPEPYTREEVLTAEFALILQELVIPQPILEWLAATVVESDRTEQAAREQTIKRLRADYDRVQARIETMYVDKLDGRITQTFFDQRAAEWRGEQDVVLRKIQEIQVAAPAPVDQAIDVVHLTSQSCQLFLQQTAEEQRRLLQVLIKNAVWQDGGLRTTLFEPFEILRHSNQESTRKEKEIAGAGQDLEIWLPGMDSNHELDKLLKSRNLLILQRQ